MNASLSCIACNIGVMKDLGNIPDGKIFQCDYCDTLRLQTDNNCFPKLTKEYGNAYRTGIDSKKHRRIFKLFQQIVGDIPCQNKKLLDIGCGDGSFLNLARKDGWDVFGVDSDPEAVETVRKNSIQAVAGTVGDFVPLRQVFDTVTLWDVFEHICDPVQATAWLADIVKPGGKSYSYDS